VRYKAAIITISDKGSCGERVDTSGPALRDMLKSEFDVGEIVIIPDEVDIIAGTIRQQVDELGTDLIITNGGTGLSKRDVTPEATRMVIEKDLPGFAEMMRAESYKITPTAVISRAICGIRKESIIINLPGSPKAATECLGFIKDALQHALEKLKGSTVDCAR
jgi:molybdenum cofactor synthesis domain-containing protein